MPTNKHASFRYRVLNQCFTNRGRRKWNLEELVYETSRYLREEFGVSAQVSRRTIQGDLSVMRSRQPRGFNAPILCEKGQYFYSDPEYSIEKPLLRQDEIDLFREAMALVKQMPGISELPLLDLLAHRFDTLIGLPALECSSYIQIETNGLVRGTEWIAPLYEAIIRRKVLLVSYQPFMEEEKTYLFHPYLLKEWRNRWYVFGREGNIGEEDTGMLTISARTLETMGFIPRQDRVWNLSLDRINALSICDDVEYMPNNLFDPATWFDDIVGINKPENTEPIDIELEVDTVASYYVESKPLHRSQHLKSRNAKRAVFSLRLIPNQELLNDLLAYGKYIRVLSPPSFREMLAERRGSESAFQSS